MVKEWLKKKGEEYKAKRKYEKAAESQIKKKAKSAYYRAKEKEQITLAKQLAMQERKETLKRKKSQGAVGWRGTLGKIGDVSAGISKGLPAAMMGEMPKSKSRKKKKEEPFPKFW